MTITGRRQTNVSIHMIRKLAAAGLTLEAVADIVGISRSTFKRRLKDDPVFAAAWRDVRPTAVHTPPAEGRSYARGGKILLNLRGELLLAIEARAASEGVGRHVIAVQALERFVGFAAMRGKPQPSP